jgi:hypothetical protein
MSARGNYPKFCVSRRFILLRLAPILPRCGSGPSSPRAAGYWGRVACILKTQASFVKSLPELDEQQALLEPRCGSYPLARSLPKREPHRRTFPTRDSLSKQGPAFADRFSRDGRFLKQGKKSLCGHPSKCNGRSCFIISPGCDARRASASPWSAASGAPSAGSSSDIRRQVRGPMVDDFARRKSTSIVASEMFQMASATIAVALPPNATNVIVFVEDWEKNENDAWYRVSWRSYKGYLRNKFLTPQN